MTVILLGLQAQPSRQFPNERYGLQWNHGREEGGLTKWLSPGVSTDNFARVPIFLTA